MRPAVDWGLATARPGTPPLGQPTRCWRTGDGPAWRSPAPHLLGDYNILRTPPIISQALSDPTALDAEKQALSDLFAGAIGSYKNPSSHRHVTLDATEAAEMIFLA